MKLVINIPCYNEESTLAQVLEELPKKIDDIDVIEVQIVDDGSTDKTREVARKYGCRVIRHKYNMGLGVAFKHGMEVALENGADIFVNTDADNQYPGKFIPALVKPVIEGEADMVIGNREPWNVKHFSPIKRMFQYVGNTMIRRIIKADVPDTVSGFRAYSREAMLQLNVTQQFSYVLDTIVQGAKKGLKIKSIPIKTNLPTRKSRLFKNIFHHMKKSGTNMIRVWVLYEPFQTFLYMTLLFAVPSLILVGRFFGYYYYGMGSGHIQSLIIAAILMTMAGISLALAVIAYLLGMNRRLIEEDLYYTKKGYYRK
jgi:glycosyltransferase involved in cell wall biosynthesis